MGNTNKMRIYFSPIANYSSFSGEMLCNQKEENRNNSVHYYKIVERIKQESSFITNKLSFSYGRRSNRRKERIKLRRSNRMNTIKKTVFSMSWLRKFMGSYSNSVISYMGGGSVCSSKSKIIKLYYMCLRRVLKPNINALRQYIYFLNSIKGKKRFSRACFSSFFPTRLMRLIRFPLVRRKRTLFFRKPSNGRRVLFPFSRSPKRSFNFLKIRRYLVQVSLWSILARMVSAFKVRYRSAFLIRKMYELYVRSSLIRGFYYPKLFSLIQSFFFVFPKEKLLLFCGLRSYFASRRNFVCFDFFKTSIPSLNQRYCFNLVGYGNFVNSTSNKSFQMGLFCLLDTFVKEIPYNTFQTAIRKELSHSLQWETFFLTNKVSTHGLSSEKVTPHMTLLTNGLLLSRKEFSHHSRILIESFTIKSYHFKLLLRKYVSLLYLNALLGLKRFFFSSELKKYYLKNQNDLFRKRMGRSRRFFIRNHARRKLSKQALLLRFYSSLIFSLSYKSNKAADRLGSFKRQFSRFTVVGRRRRADAKRAKIREIIAAKRRRKKFKKQVEKQKQKLRKSIQKVEEAR